MIPINITHSNMAMLQTTSPTTVHQILSTVRSLKVLPYTIPGVDYSRCGQNNPDDTYADVHKSKQGNETKPSRDEVTSPRVIVFHLTG